MNRFSVGCLLLVLTLTGAVAAGPEKAVTKDEALKAITVFQTDPVSKEGFAATAVFMSYAMHSDKIHISLSHSVVPWLKDKDASDEDTRKLLLGAYVAGNLESQLKSGKAVDDVYSGWEQVLTTYAQLLRINSAAKIAEVDELKRKDANGVLRDYANEVQSGGK